MLAADDRLLAHVLEQPDSYVHYLCLVEIGTSVARAGAPTSPAALAEWLRARPKKRVLDAIYRPAPPGTVAVLDRLPSRALARRQYETLLELLRDPAAAKLLRHAPVVRGCLIEALAGLPSELRGAPVLARASSNSTLERGPRLRPPAVHPHVQRAVYDALLEERQLEIRYRARGRSCAEPRTIHPLGLILKDGVAYLVARLWNYDDPVHLALHRIEAAEPIAGRVQYPNGFDFGEHVETAAEFSYPTGYGTMRLSARACSTSSRPPALD